MCARVESYTGDGDNRDPWKWMLQESCAEMEIMVAGLQQGGEQMLSFFKCFKFL